MDDQQDDSTPGPGRQAKRSSAPGFPPSPPALLHRKTLAARPGRGMTIENVLSYGIISDEEASTFFKDVPISEKEIKALPRKVSPIFRLFIPPSFLSRL